MKQYVCNSFTGNYTVSVFNLINKFIEQSRRVSGREYKIHTATLREPKGRRERRTVTYDVIFEYEVPYFQSLPIY